jgi:hypothetical protein
MTYDLRRLRLHGMIERIPKTHRYRVTDFGLRAALFFTRVHARLYRPGVAQILPHAPPNSSSLQRAFEKIENGIDGVHQLQGSKNLIEVLSLAEGLKTEAGNEIKITRAKSSRTITLKNAEEAATGQFTVAEVNVKKRRGPAC